MRVWRRIDRSTDYTIVAEVDEAGNFRQWCEDGVMIWNIWRTTLSELGWSSIEEFLQERGKRFKEVEV